MTEEAKYRIVLEEKVTSGLDKIEGRMNNFESKLLGFKDVLAGVFGGTLLVDSLEGLVSGLKDAASEVVNITREFTNLEDAIKFASGKDAAANIAFLDKEIDRLGLDMMATYSGFKTFQGAIMGTSLEGAKARDIFTGVAEASTVMKLTADETKGVFLALGQMASKGTVSAEELRGQLGERLPGAFGIFADALGVSTSKLGDMLKKGEVLAEDALPKFAAQLHKVFGPGVSDAQNTFNANLNRFNNYILEAKLKIGNELLPALNEVVKLIPKLDFTPLISPIIKFGDAFSDLMGEIFQGLSAFDAIQGFFDSIGQGIYLALTPVRWGIELIKQMVLVVKESLPIFQGFAELFRAIATRDFASIGTASEKIRLGFLNFGDANSASFNDFMKREEQGFKDVFGKKKDAEGDADSAYADGAGAASRRGAAGAGGKAAIAGVQTVQAGTRNVTLNIQKLVGEIKFETYNGNSQSQMIEMVKKALLSAVNDVNIVPQ